MSFFEQPILNSPYKIPGQHWELDGDGRPTDTAKGAEFRAVAVPRLGHDIIPDEGRLLAARDEAQLDEIMTTERHLLYVAATRARDFLWMSGVAPVSEFLSDLADLEA